MVISLSSYVTDVLHIVVMTMLIMGSIPVGFFILRWCQVDQLSFHIVVVVVVVFVAV